MEDCPQEGDLEVLATLAERTCGVTYKVRDRATGKLLVGRPATGTAACDGPALRRLGRDVRLLTSLRDPRLAAYHGVGRLDGRVVILRDWVDGLSLMHHPSYAVGADPGGRGVRAAAGDLERVASGVLEALHVLHVHGRLALGLSPHNLFLLDDGGLVVADWGIRHAADVQARTSAPYASPETAAGLPAGPPSDLHALAAVLFEIATGRLPHLGGPPRAEDLERLGRLLGPVVTRLLARDPLARHASAREALRALGRTAPRPERFSAVRFHNTRLAGRDTELGELRRAVEQLAAGQGDLLYVRGAAGVGKTRLLAEVARGAALRGLLVLQGARPEPSGYPFGRLAPCFERIARDMAAWSDEEVKEAVQLDGRVLLELSPAFHALEAVRRLPPAPLLGAEASRRRLLRVAARVVSAFARRRPVLVLVDDLESADPLSLDFIRYLARTEIHHDGGRRTPILLVAAYEEQASLATAPGLLRASSVALRARGLARELVLKALAPHEVRDLLTEHLGTDELPPGFVARLMDVTGGVPLEIEETLARLAAAGVLDGPVQAWVRALERPRREAGASVADDEDIALILGGSGVVQALRPGAAPAAALDTLGANAHRLLEAAALAGDGVGIEVLRMASGLSAAAFDDALLRALASDTLLETEPEVFVFRHPRLRALHVDSLDQDRCRAVHARIGLAIEQHVGSLDERTPLLLAHHFHHAADLERSLLYLPLAARIFKDRHAPGAALLHLDCFFRHLQALDPEARLSHLGRRLQAQHCMAQTLVQLDRRSDASKAFREMAALAEGNGRDRELVAAWSEIASLSLQAADLATAESFARRAATLARTRELATLVAANLMVLGTAALRRQQPDEAMWNLTGALEIVTEQGDTLNAARASLAIGDVHASRFDHAGAVLAFRRAYQQFRQLDDKVGVSTALNRLGRSSLALGDPRKALGYHREALQLEREADDRENIGATLDLLGDAYRERGDLALATESFQEALSLKRELADVRGSADSLVYIAHAALQAGRLDEAVGHLEQALTLARRAGNPRAEAAALVRLAQTRLRRCEPERALELAEQGLSRAQTLGDLALECRALLVLGATGDVERAVQAAHRAERLAAEAGLKDVRFRALVLLADRSRRGGDEERAHLHYREALEVAGEILASGREDRSFLRRDDVVEALRRASEFVGQRDPQAEERYPALRMHEPASVAG